MSDGNQALRSFRPSSSTRCRTICVRRSLRFGCSSRRCKAKRVQDPEKAQQILDIVATETKRLSEMVERLLGWARMEAGRRIYRLENESPSDVVDAALRARSSRRCCPTIRRRFAWKNRSATTLPKVRVDRAAMSEALLNLLQNAFHYTGEKGDLGALSASRSAGCDQRVRQRSGHSKRTNSDVCLKSSIA